MTWQCYHKYLYFDTDTEISDTVPLLIFHSIYCIYTLRLALSSPTASLTRIHLLSITESEYPRGIAGIPHHFNNSRKNVASALL